MMGVTLAARIFRQAAPVTGCGGCGGGCGSGCGGGCDADGGGGVFVCGGGWRPWWRLCLAGSACQRDGIALPRGGVAVAVTAEAEAEAEARARELLSSAAPASAPTELAAGERPRGNDGEERLAS